MKVKKRYIVMLTLTGLISLAVLLPGQEGQSGSIQRKKESCLPYENWDSKGERNIRVLLKTDGFSEITHANIQIQAEFGLLLRYGEEEQRSNPGEIIVIAPDDVRFQNGTILIKPLREEDRIKVESLNRGYGIPSYRGEIELFTTAEGIVLVNELPIEQYLYAVVPSEMPASYNLEALKAQAVCARSYAYNQSGDYSYSQYRAHVDDSTTFQVYGNSMEKESTISAVDATRGEKIWYAGKIATAYYYSTSCGKSASITAWGGEMTEVNSYLQSVKLCDESGEDYEKDLPWYRWEVSIPRQMLEDQIELYVKKEIGSLVSVKIKKDKVSGIVQKITAVGTEGTIEVETENKIRRAFGGTACTIHKNDGTESTCGDLLPSAFFDIKQIGDIYRIQGGGYGHGIGMSQNGANEMAKQGKNYKEILTTFYTGVSVK